MIANSNHSVYSRKKFVRSKNRPEGSKNKILFYGSHNQIAQFVDLQVIEEKTHLFLSKTFQALVIQDQNQVDEDIVNGTKIRTFGAIPDSFLDSYGLKSDKKPRSVHCVWTGKGTLKKESGLDKSKEVKRPAQYQGICVKTDHQTSFYKLNGIASPGIGDTTPPLYADFNEKLHNILLNN